ncbi:MAG: helix-turn-helix domain-containing protein, partial [Actinomycetota bacterium]
MRLPGEVHHEELLTELLAELSGDAALRFPHMTFAALLKGYRAGAGFTQEELAEKAEVSARTVSDVERGLRRRIYRETAGRLADALGLDGDERTAFEAAARGRTAPAESPVSRLPVP